MRQEKFLQIFSPTNRKQPIFFGHEIKFAQWNQADVIFFQLTQQCHKITWRSAPVQQILLRIDYDVHCWEIGKKKNQAMPWLPSKKNPERVGLFFGEEEFYLLLSENLKMTMWGIAQLFRNYFYVWSVIKTSNWSAPKEANKNESFAENLHS